MTYDVQEPDGTFLEIRIIQQRRSADGMTSPRRPHTVSWDRRAANKGAPALPTSTGKVRKLFAHPATGDRRPEIAASARSAVRDGPYRQAAKTLVSARTSESAELKPQGGPNVLR